MKVYVTGGYGFLGSRVSALLQEKGVEVLRDKSDFVDLRFTAPYASLLFESPKVDSIIHCAGVVGGMLDNAKKPATYLADNIRMGLNILDAAKHLGCRLVIAGSSCMYPDPCYGPYSIPHLWHGKPYEGNSGYGIAKRVICEASLAYRQEHGVDAFTCVFPNLYGPLADDGEKSHFVASVIRKIKEAKASNAQEVLMMGDGTATREFLYVDDAARALIFAMEHKELGPGPLNFGTNEERSIAETVEAIKIFMGYEGKIIWGSIKDNGQQRKIMESSYAYTFGWRPEVSFLEGLIRCVKA